MVMRRILLIELSVALTLVGCSDEKLPVVESEPYGNDAELLFQKREVLRYSIDQLEQKARLRQELLGSEESLPAGEGEQSNPQHPE